MTLRTTSKIIKCEVYKVLRSSLTDQYKAQILNLLRKSEVDVKIEYTVKILCFTIKKRQRMLKIKFE